MAIVVDERGALSIKPGKFRRTVELLPLQSLLTLPNLQIRRMVDHYTDEIANFFVSHAGRPTHFEAGLQALHEGNLEPLLLGGFFPNRPTHDSDDQYAAAWAALKSNLQPLDFIFTIDLESQLSRFIAWATDGTWSHCAVHTGGGEIWESVTSGIRHGPIELYKGRRYWVAAYRHLEALKKPRTTDEVNAATHGHRLRQNSYHYRGALKYGWKAFRGDHSHNLTPNSTVLQGNLVLIAHV